MKPLLEKGQENNGKENQDDPFPKYDFFSSDLSKFIFVCSYRGSVENSSLDRYIS